MDGSPFNDMSGHLCLSHTSNTINLTTLIACPEKYVGYTRSKVFRSPTPIKHGPDNLSYQHPPFLPRRPTYPRRAELQIGTFPHVQKPASFTPFARFLVARAPTAHTSAAHVCCELARREAARRRGRRQPRRLGRGSSPGTNPHAPGSGVKDCTPPRTTNRSISVSSTTSECAHTY